MKNANKLRTHARALAMGSLLPLGIALANPPTSQVFVTNPASDPVPVAGAVSINNIPSVTVANSSANPVAVTLGNTNPIAVTLSVTPYQEEQSIPDSSSCAPQCILNYATVPSGKRLVITHVSAQLGPAADAVLLQGVGADFFVPKPYPTSSYLGTAVSLYYQSGQAPSARMFVPDSTLHTSLIVTLVGYLVPSQ